jgi:hypothetical protein
VSHGDHAERSQCLRVKGRLLSDLAAWARRSPVGWRVGYGVIACDVSLAALQAFDEPGTNREHDPLTAARQVTLLGICVRTDEQLEQLVDGSALFTALGDGGLTCCEWRRPGELASRNIGQIDLHHLNANGRVVGFHARSTRLLFDGVSVAA